jgi:hypothetical protein
VDYPGKSSFPAFIGKSKQLEYFERQSGTEGHNYPTNPSINVCNLFKGGKKYMTILAKTEAPRE